jgi:hypothetical protein
VLAPGPAEASRCWISAKVVASTRSRSWTESAALSDAAPLVGVGAAVGDETATPLGVLDGELDAELDDEPGVPSAAPPVASSCPPAGAVATLDAAGDCYDGSFVMTVPGPVLPTGLVPPTGFAPSVGVDLTPGALAMLNELPAMARRFEPSSGENGSCSI